MIVETGKQFVKELKHVTKSTTLPPNRGTTEHLPIANEGHEKECWFCRYKLQEAAMREEGPGGRGYKTHWECSACTIPLCLNTTRNCFTEFHMI